MKRVGGIRKGIASKSVAAVPDAPAKRVGAIRNPVVRGAVHQHGHREACPDNCEGQYMDDGAWVHSDTCKHARVRWKRDGSTIENWRCYHECKPTELLSCITHAWDCPFWSHNNFTPF